MLIRSLTWVLIVACPIPCCAFQAPVELPMTLIGSNAEPSSLLSENSIDAGSAPRPMAPFGLTTEWIPANDSGLVSTEANATLPLLFLGSPPPLVKIGFRYTDLFAAEDFGLAGSLYEYTVGISGIRRINERWMIRTMLGVGFATDNLNTSSDSWQFRGGMFGIYQPNEKLNLTFGALATGRDDLPVIPAIGAVWMPHDAIRYDFMFPKPRVNFLLGGDSQRQHWAYLGCSINGTTWGYERSPGIDDRLTYKDFRIIAGWESRPTASARTPFSIGRTIQAEIGFAVGREFEFIQESRIEELGDSFVIGVSTKF